MCNECFYCKKTFSCKSNLERHQITAKFCLALRPEPVLNLKTYNCNYCEYTNNLKYNLAKHVKTCKYKIISNKREDENIRVKMLLLEQEIVLMKQQRDIEANKLKVLENKQRFKGNLIRDNLNMKEHSYTMSTLTNKYIEEALKPLITETIVKSGLKGIINVVINTLLEKDSVPIYWCTNIQNKKFRMITEQEGNIIEEDDNYARQLRILLQGPLFNLIQPIAKNESSMIVLEQIRDLMICGTKFAAELAIQLPTTSQGISSGLRHCIVPNEEMATYKPIEIESNLLYFIIPKLLNAFKIGYWSGTEKNLKRRYITPYGKDLRILLFNCKNIQDEQGVHSNLKKYSAGGELYNLDSLDQCILYCEEHFGNYWNYGEREISCI